MPTASAFSHPRLMLAVVLMAVAVLRGAQPPAPPAKSLVWTWRTEQHWLVSTVVRDLAALGSVHESGARIEVGFDAAEASQPSRFIVLADDQAIDALTLDDAHGVWAPATYASLARRLVEARRWSAADAEPPANLVAGIVHVDLGAFIASQAALSQSLTKQPNAPALHESAALLVGALALREAAGAFTDTRELLARMTAHLALADALRRAHDAPSPHGRLARATLLALAGRQADALALLAPADADSSPDVVAFARGLRTRITLDWRARPSDDTTTFERLQIVRALSARLDGASADAFVEGYATAPLPDWGRILLSGSYSVETANRFALASVDVELAELDRTYGLVHGQPLAAERRVAALGNATSHVVEDDGARSHIAVVDWALWAGHFQRHLASAMGASSRAMRIAMSFTPEEQRLESSRDVTFAALPLQPLVLALRADSGWGFHSALVTLSSTWARPELVTPEVWMKLRERTAQTRVAVAIAPEREWFAPGMPTGAVPEDAWWRSHGTLGGEGRRREMELAQWVSIAPFRRALAMDLLWVRHGDRATPGDVQRELGRFLPYDVQALERLAWVTPRSPERLDAYQRLCDMLVDKCYALAAELIDLEQDDRAAVPYRRWFFGSRDRVRAANGAGWLVNYELDHGRRAEALRVAELAAETGSHGGILALASLRERTMDYDAAQTLYREAADRYESPAGLLAFYLRYQRQANASDYSGETRQLIGRVFPGDVSRTSLAALTTSGRALPDGGVTVLGPYPRLRQAGVREGDVIVAVDGIRVRNVAQFRTASWLTRDPDMRLIYWRGDTYLETQGRFVGKDIAERVRTYDPSIQPR